VPQWQVLVPPSSITRLNGQITGLNGQITGLNGQITGLNGKLQDTFANYTTLMVAPTGLWQGIDLV
jgi:hypothetical protein